MIWVRKCNTAKWFLTFEVLIRLNEFTFTDSNKISLVGCIHVMEGVHMVLLIFKSSAILILIVIW